MKAAIYIIAVILVFAVECAHRNRKQKSYEEDNPGDDGDQWPVPGTISDFGISAGGAGSFTGGFDIESFNGEEEDAVTSPPRKLYPKLNQKHRSH